MYEDNESRVFIIAIDESDAQTERVLEYMAKKASGEITNEMETKNKQILQNICHLLQPYQVKNQYRLELPQNVKHRRRLTQMLHDFIAQVTILNQFRRQKSPLTPEGEHWRAKFYPILLRNLWEAPPSEGLGRLLLQKSKI
ncbi:hypothetical protein E5F92_000140 [Flavobacterium columnare]|uniref:hypothetical protein n=1 Tax=Flavobacterium columnare TaxID=996 RepID=UPI002989C2B3|nr:hypothetical protein [Flavobacterium columnare]MCH4831166.1 hypothetical protein [Flavobacterium columnare]